MGKTHWKKLTNPDYLGAYSFEEGEKQRLIKIISVSKETIKQAGGRSAEVIIAQLVNSKPMILNKTNCKAIEKITGSSYIEDWTGVELLIKVEKVKFAGEFVDALRVVENKVVKQKPELNESDANWQKVLTALKSGYTIQQIEAKYSISQAAKQKLIENK